MPAPPNSKQQKNIKNPANTKTYGSGTSTAYGGRSSTSGTSTAYGGRPATGGGSSAGGLAKMPVSRPFSYAGPKGAQSLNQAARYASVGGVGMMPQTQASGSDLDKMARMMLAESGSIRNPMGGIATQGLQGVGEVIRNRVLSDRFPNTVPQVLSQKNQFSPVRDGSINKYSPVSPGYQGAYDIAKAIMSGEQAPTVGSSLNYANMSTVNNPKISQASSATKKGFNAMTPVKTVVSAKNPALQHSFGTWGDQSDVSFPQAGAGATYQPASYSPPAATSAPWSNPLGGLWNKATTAASDVVNRAKPGLAKLNATISALPGTTDQKASIVGAYAKGGTKAAAGPYMKALLSGATRPFDSGYATPQRSAEERGGNGTLQTAQSTNQDRLTNQQKLETLSLEPKQRVLLQEYMNKGMTFEQAMEVLRKGGQTAQAPWFQWNQWPAGQQQSA